MKNISEFTQCANCGACYNICPVDAIHVDDQDLFYRVVVDQDKCIDCGRCAAVCPVNTPQDRQDIRGAFSAVYCDEKIVKISSSGGAFTALAEWILEQGGVVYGACYADDRKSVVFRSTDQVLLDELRRSKYVESLVEESFRDVKKQLERGRMVLLCGTPCQVAGLLRFLGREYNNLYTCDFTCGGLPSHELYRSYLRDLEQRFGAKVSDVNFRPKIFGWENHAIRIRFSNGRVYESPSTLDPYFCAFVERHYSVRDNCLDCGFADNHYADIILADFWKFREFGGEKEHHRGLSLVISNSEKGQAMLRAVSGKLRFRELDPVKACYNMKRKSRNEIFLQRRKTFMDSCRSEGLMKAAGYLNIPSGSRKLALRIKSAVKKNLWGVK